MWKKVPVLLAIVVILFPGVAFGGLYDYDPEFNAWLLLFPGEVNLGLPQRHPSGGDYWETRSPLNIAFQCLRFRRGWQVSINGGDFKSGNHTIRRQEMEWRVSPGNYESMKPAGQEVILARSQDYPGHEWGLFYFMLNFRMLLDEWAPAGEYSSEMRVTFFCW